jgi:hypothetical protein
MLDFPTGTTSADMEELQRIRLAAVELEPGAAEA